MGERWQKNGWRALGAFRDPKLCDTKLEISKWKATCFLSFCIYLKWSRTIYTERTENKEWMKMSGKNHAVKATIWWQNYSKTSEAYVYNLETCVCGALACIALNFKRMERDQFKNSSTKERRIMSNSSERENRKKASRNQANFSIIFSMAFELFLSFFLCLSSLALLLFGEAQSFSGSIQLFWLVCVKFDFRATIQQSTQNWIAAKSQWNCFCSDDMYILRTKKHQTCFVSPPHTPNYINFQFHFARPIYLGSR